MNHCWSYSLARSLIIIHLILVICYLIFSSFLDFICIYLIVTFCIKTPPLSLWIWKETITPSPCGFDPAYHYLQKLLLVWAGIYYCTGFDHLSIFGAVAGDWFQLVIFLLMTRTDRIGKLQYDTEIEKTAKRLRKEAKLRKQASSSKSDQEE